MVIFRIAIFCVDRRVHKNWWTCWTTWILQNIQIRHFLRPRKNLRLVYLRMIWTGHVQVSCQFRGITCRYSGFIYHPLTSPQTCIQRTFQLPTNSRYVSHFWLETFLMFLNEKSNKKKWQIHFWISMRCSCFPCALLKDLRHLQTSLLQHYMW